MISKKDYTWTFKTATFLLDGVIKDNNVHLPTARTYKKGLNLQGKLISCFVIVEDFVSPSFPVMLYIM